MQQHTYSFVEKSHEGENSKGVDQCLDVVTASHYKNVKYLIRVTGQVCSEPAVSASIVKTVHCKELPVSRFKDGQVVGGTSRCTAVVWQSD